MGTQFEWLGALQPHGILRAKQEGECRAFTKDFGRSGESFGRRERSFEEHPEAARILEERFWEIFEDYKCRLREMKSLLIVGDGTTPEQLENNARSVLGRAAKVLGGEERPARRGGGDLPQHRELCRAPEPSPRRVLQSRCRFVQGDRHGRGEEPRARPPEKIAEIALAVQEIVMDRVSRMVMASYVDYLLTKVKETPV